MEPDATDFYEVIGNGLERLPILEGFDEADLAATRVRNIDPNLAFWAVIDGILLVFILGGNILTILALRFSRRLRSVISNMFILSLAISDMIVGFTLPYHLAFYMGSNLGGSRECCLLRFFLIILACCVSIWSLIAIAVDRYIAIVYPLHYTRYMTRKVALILLGFGWCVGITFAIIPLFWNNWSTATQCEFDEILPRWYMAGIITPGFSMIWVCMLILYWRIWREASKHAKQIRSSFTGLHEAPSDWKSVQVVVFILGCFSMCWLPYFIIACSQMFKIFDKTSPVLYKAVFTLAMANSGLNPIIYAWKNSNFRRAFGRLLRCKSPDYNDFSEHSIRSNVHRKSSTFQHQGETIPQWSTPPNSACIGKFTMFDDITKTSIVTSSQKDCVQNEELKQNIVATLQTGNKTNCISTQCSSSCCPLHIKTTLMRKQPEYNTSKCHSTIRDNTDQTKRLQSKELTSVKLSPKHLIVEQIDYEGNCNTQIRILSDADKRIIQK